VRAAADAGRARRVGLGARGRGCAAAAAVRHMLTPPRRRTRRGSGAARARRPRSSAAGGQPSAALWRHSEGGSGAARVGGVRRTTGMRTCAARGCAAGCGGAQWSGGPAHLLAGRERAGLARVAAGGGWAVSGAREGAALCLQGADAAAGTRSAGARARWARRAAARAACLVFSVRRETSERLWLRGRGRLKEECACLPFARRCVRVLVWRPCVPYVRAAVRPECLYSFAAVCCICPSSCTAYVT